MMMLNNKLIVIKKLCATIATILFLLSNSISFAQQDKIIRFVSTRSNEVNARNGPGVNYPVVYVYTKKSEPLAVVQEFNEWRKVKDFSGSESWIHSSLLSTKRYAVVSLEGIHEIYRFATKKSRIVAKIEKNTRCKIEKITEIFCQISVDGYKGWIEKKLLWGIFVGEK